MRDEPDDVFDEPDIECRECKGTGEQVEYEDDEEKLAYVCIECGGSGKVPAGSYAETRADYISNSESWRGAFVK